jgi:hypothetical protein
MKRDVLWVLVYTTVMATLAFAACKTIDTMWPIQIK